uniref:Uncharacterized protein n=1 Tax=Avena sativa TaxID=4498 RepID=A0ACD5ZAS2_AVESA
MAAAAAPAAAPVAPAPAPAAGKRKRDLSEDDVYLILHKYTPATILTALQEISKHAGRRRIDWRALVAKTSTGITSAREYQMLWRYFAYRHDFVENVDDSAQPLGDESDLECEIEPFPTPSSEAVAEASGFAKILMYGSSREQAFSHRVNSEVPVLNTPNEKIPRVPSEKQLGPSHRLTNGIGPVSSSKQASHTGLSPDPFDGNGPHKKKKKPKPWSKEEDADLTTGVHKCGEGNWLDILHKYSFDSTRTAVQLSQRWALISKRQGTTKPANARPVTSNFDIKATQKAFSMALDDMPIRRPGLSALRSGIPQQSTQHHAPVFGTATPELKSATSSSSLPLPVPVPASAPVPMPVQVQMPLPQVQQAPAQAPPLRVSNTSNKSRNNSKKQALTNAPSSIQAAAIAAGGRIATPSVATSLLKAAQSTKAVHIRSRATRSSKTSTSSKSSTVAGESGTQLGSAQPPEHPVCSAPTTSQSNVVPAVAGVSPPEQSASAHLFETEKTLSTTPGSGPCDSMEMDDDSTFCVVTMEDLFPEDVKQPDTVDPKAEEMTDPKAEEIKAEEMIDPKAEEMIDPKDADMLEFDRFVAQGCLSIDKSKGVKVAPGAQGAVASQKKQPKQLPTAGKSIPIFSRAPASMKKTKTTLGSHAAACLPTVTSSGLVGTGNAGVLSKALGGQQTGLGTTGKQNRCQEIMAQKQHAANSRSNGMAKNVSPVTVTPAKNAAPGAATPARSTVSGAVTPARNTPPGAAGAPVRNAAPGTGTLGKNTAPGAGTPARNTALGTGTLAKNAAPGAGAPARLAAPGTGTLAKNTAPSAGAPARNVAPGTGTLAKNAAPGTGAPARNAAPGAGTLAKNTAAATTGPAAKDVAPGTGPPANRQHNPMVNNGASKGNPPASK